MTKGKRSILIGAVVAVVALSAGYYFVINYGSAPKFAGSGDTVGSNATPAADSVDLLENQLKSIKVAAIEERDFPIEKEAIGSIDFNQELLTQVFTPYQGKIIG